MMVEQRDNELTRKLNELARLNEQYGTRREGGGVVSSPVPTSQMLPPTPRSVSSEEEAQLRAEYEAQWGEPLPTNDGPPLGGIERVASPHIYRHTPSGPVEDFVEIDLSGSVVIANNGQIFPINEETVKAWKQQCFKIMLDAEDAKRLELAKKLGFTIQEEPPNQKPVTSGTPIPAKRRGRPSKSPSKP